MKRLTQIGALVLTVLLSLSMVACANTYPKIKKAFENEGYKQSEAVEGVTKDFKSYTNKDGKEVALTVHVLTKLTSTAVILEFKATDEMIQFYNDNKAARDAVKDVTENEDAKAFYNQLKEKGYANGNCMLIPIGDAKSMCEIMKNA